MSLNKLTKSELIIMLLKSEEQNAILNARLEKAVVEYRKLRDAQPTKRLSRMVVVGEFADKAELLATYDKDVAKYVVKQVDGKLQACLKQWG